MTHSQITAAIHEAATAEGFNMSDTTTYWNFKDGWNSSMHAYVGGPARGFVWRMGRRAGIAFYMAQKAAG